MDLMFIVSDHGTWRDYYKVITVALRVKSDRKELHSDL